jgi:hypothetical protein
MEVVPSTAGIGHALPEVVGRRYDAGPPPKKECAPGIRTRSHQPGSSGALYACLTTKAVGARRRGITQARSSYTVPYGA